MRKSVLSIVAAAAIAGTSAVNVQAEEVTVKKGDTLWGISQKYEATVDQIKEWNGLSSDTIYIKDVLDVYKKETYTVNKGDTLWGIAKEFDVEVSALKEWNKLNTEVIHPDQELIVYPEAPGNIKVEKPAEEQKAAAPVAAEPKQETDKQESSKEKQPAETVEAPSEPKAEQPSEPKAEQPSEPKTEQPAAEGTQELTMEATAYTASCEGCSGITATGINLLENPDMKVISVDPSVIPLGSKVYVEGYGEAIAGDTGGAIKGNKIDIFIPNKEDAINYGRQTVKVTVLD
ncbi:LysM peptidoglycan-binding domain-containing protein [Cytobacillus purgationiresistens]|uniref:3D (Asp-Asp-Asp) domain-containing protein/LysM repeat protein n=1 Tax=Cytobacillus purgationiresistens TaxID=863449 RepID=A0ABU0AB20_9BACI|nr:3D domain-containing protein [Cytobacillus purgationiresistens]MDQ0268451.1 3D (Asp-Asp-Asp) domain-containing protein/LysM repeat protein [Cytobacillus purgationiresistens]